MNERAALRQTTTPTTTEADRIGFFGKLPSHGDFVSTGLGRGLQDMLDIWLQSGLQRLQQAFPDDWEAWFKAMPTWRFVVERGHWGPSTLVGIILPSLDRVGRSFPLVIASQIPGFTGDPRGLCLDDSWFTAAEGIAETSAHRDFDINAFIARLRRLRSPHPGDIEPEAGTGRSSGTLWWRSGDDRRLIGFRTSGAPQPADVLKLLGEHQTPTRTAARPVHPAPLARPEPAIAPPAAAATPGQRPAPTSASRPRLRLAYSDVSHPGTRLSINADHLLASPKRGLFALADGIGEGNAAVEVARIAITALEEITPQETVDDLLQTVKGKLGRAHGLIQAARMSADREPPAASIAVLAVHGGDFALSWAGDVRCYLLRDGMMRCITRDHLEVGLKRGLSRYLGRPGQFSPETLVDNLHDGDRLLLCSNPLCRVLPERSIAEILISTDLDETAAVLGQEALIANCRDNFSAIVIDAGVA
ncbi:type VI secretion system-associated protein TagF [Neorhizobium alkalisoli]|uniref:Type VI secretion system protein ImpM n=1 Tax=Neorhizobium alkalisoli TaxID=528178 RepID=A0A561QI62_9HYPH|nr:type VI secretion system-associated protein TagF [Neorhizobium alkalisoli]TWF50057.1 type VI secretion system protein ImpM [Neorhizobium alkalisoli]